MLYLVLYNSCKCEIGAYPMNTSKDLTSETIRILQEEYITLGEGDTLTLETRD